jgi:hypothetical protein
MLYEVTRVDKGTGELVAMDCAGAGKAKVAAAASDASKAGTILK